MKIIAHIVFFLFAFIAQLTLGKLIAIYQIQPDFLLIVVVWLARYEKQFTGTIAGFGVGLLQDIYSSGFLGLMALAKSVTGFIAGRFGITESKNKPHGILLTLLICCVIHEVIFQTIYYLGTGQSWLKIFFRFILPGSAYTFVLGMIIYQILPHRYWLK